MKKNKLKIEIADKAGFCYGVKKAVEHAEKAPETRQRPIYTVGPLMHNKIEVNRLADMGIKTIDNPESVRKGTLIIRTHGLPKELMQKIKKNTVELIDATCPFVKRVQNLIEKLTQEGYNIVIIGEKDHPETIGLVSYASKQVKVVNSVSGVKKLKLPEPVAVVSQTTQSAEKFDTLVRELSKKYKSIKIFNTICSASNERQEEAANLAKKVDVMFVIGGKNSGNTTRLKDICSKYVATYHVESEKEITKKHLKGVKVAGITAGASTPTWLIKSIIKYMQQI
ncbi:MAG: 4-hydroxy-3-methylbut-2-enyl diphosphate reductase [Elusimicrobia bacterium RIFOXYA2_FULL_39_19]|nr:MAG: 4-hydroxy-3-methylbut-2-enyl diphosphate reductase [Elusimicrobia bacterium RIFOXYA2_FULL_39_19]